MPTRRDAVHSYPDPSIRECAKHLLLEAMDDINRWVSCGDSFYAARTRVLEIHAVAWVTHFGKEAASMAVRGLHCLAPNEVLDVETQRKQRDRRVSLCGAELAAYDSGRNTWLNRAWLSMFGRRLY